MTPTLPARAALALALAATLGGCALFKGRTDHRPKTAVVGERIPVLVTASDAEVDPGLAKTPVAVPAPAVNPAWAQPGGTATKAPGNVSLAPALSRAWTARIGKSSPKARFGAAPTVGGGRLYVVDTDAVVHAFDLKTGGAVWKTALSTSRKEKPSRFGGGASFDDGKVYATDGLGDAAALDAATGRLLWKVRPAGPLRGAPSIANGNVYVVTQDNQLFALSQDKGDVAWTVSATLETAGVFGVAAPAIAQGTVVAGFSSGELTALRYENGRVVWQDQLARTSISTSVASISDIDASPIVEAGRVYAIGQGGAHGGDGPRQRPTPVGADDRRHRHPRAWRRLAVRCHRRGEAALHREEQRQDPLDHPAPALARPEVEEQPDPMVGSRCSPAAACC